MKRSGRRWPFTLTSLVCAWLSCAWCGAAEAEAVAHPEASFPPDRTVAWTPLFQAAWDALRGHHGKLLRVEPPNALVKRLNEFHWNTDATMPAAGWKIWAGEATDEFIATANREVAAMFGENTGGFAVRPAREGFVALGVLQRDVVFYRPLHRAKSASLTFRSSQNQTKVRFFGTRGEASARFSGLVRVLAYKEGSHAIAIPGKGDESVICYLPASNESFAVARRQVHAWLSQEPERAWGELNDPFLHAQDDVRIPCLKFTQTHDFTPELKGSLYFDGDERPWRMNQALQQVSFKLSEKGAQLRVKVEASDDPFGAPPPPKPRQLIFDRPFFVFLWRDGADWPYFGAWIGDASGMETAVSN